jgi:glycerophosphoryl diester phosphodiesterase
MGMHPYFDIPRPVVIGHRGAAGERPENTLLSFEKALEDGAQILESDIQVTRDGVPILLHDPDVDRTTEGRGAVSELDLQGVRRLDAGHAFEDASGHHPYRGQSIHIPSLEEAFERFPEARFNLEIKSADPRATSRTLDLVARFGRPDRTLLTAGETPIMKQLRRALAQHAAQPAVGASQDEIVAAVRSALSDAPMPAGVMALQIPAHFLDQPLVTPELVLHAHAHGVEIHVWTINDLDEIEALLDLGVDGIVTDHPGRMVDWLARAGRR